MGIREMAKATYDRYTDPRRREKKMAIRDLNLGDQYSPSMFSSVQAVHRTAKQKQDEKRKSKDDSKKTRKDKVLRVKKQIKAMLMALKLIAVNEPAAPAPTSTLPPQAVNVPAAVQAVPAEVIENPPEAFSKFQDAVLAITKAYSSDREARLSQMTDQIALANKLQVEAEKDGSTNPTLRDYYIGTLKELHNNLSENEVLYQKEWAKLRNETGELNNRRKACLDGDKQAELDLMFSKMNEADQASDKTAYTEQQEKIRLEVNKCSTLEDRYKADLSRILVTLGTLEELGKTAPCNKHEYTQQLEPFILLLKDLQTKSSTILSSDENYLTGILKEAEEKAKDVKTACQKKEMPNTAHLAQVSPYRKAAKYALYTAAAVGTGLVVSSALVGVAPTVAAVGSVGSAINLAGSWLGTTGLRTAKSLGSAMYNGGIMGMLRNKSLEQLQAEADQAAAASAAAPADEALKADAAAKMAIFQQAQAAMAEKAAADAKAAADKAAADQMVATNGAPLQSAQNPEGWGSYLMNGVKSGASTLKGLVVTDPAQAAAAAQQAQADYEAADAAARALPATDPNKAAADAAAQAALAKVTQAATALQAPPPANAEGAPLLTAQNPNETRWERMKRLGSQAVTLGTNAYNKGSQLYGQVAPVYNAAKTYGIVKGGLKRTRVKGKQRLRQRQKRNFTRFQ